MKIKLIILIIFFLLISGFVVYKNKQNKNMLSINDSQTDLSDKLNRTIEEYLPQNVLEPGYSGKVFCVYHQYGYDLNDTKISTYLWAYCEEYYKKGNQILMGAGVSMPVRLNIIKDGDNLKVTDFQKPIDGEGYAKSIKEMFPEKYSLDAINGFNVKDFPQSPKEKALEYFKKL